jgi:transcriptional regulator with XRE-family HTH domain
VHGRQLGNDAGRQKALTDKERKSLADRLEQLRKAAGLNQQELADKAGLSMSVVSQIERGKKLDPRVSTIEALADALGVSVDELLGRPPAKKPPRGKAK